MMSSPKCNHGATPMIGLPFGGCPDCRQEKSLSGGVGEISQSKKKAFIDMTPIEQRMTMHQAFSKTAPRAEIIAAVIESKEVTGQMPNRPAAIIPPGMEVKQNMCTWHQCQVTRVKDSRLCLQHKTLQALLDATPLPRAKRD